MGRCESCKAKKQKNASDGISFHRFPKDETQAKLWLKNMGKENWQPQQFSVLCSAHFTPDCFKKHFNRSTLHEGRVPTIFNHADQIVTYATEETSSSNSFDEGGDVSSCQDVSMETESNSAEGSANYEHDGAESVGQFENQEDIGLLSSPIEAGPSETAAEASTITATPKRRQYANHDHNYENSPRTTAEKLHLTRKKLFAHKKAIRVLRQRVKRLKKSVTSLKDVIAKLKEVNLISESSSNALSAFEDVPLQVFPRMLHNHRKGTLTREKYPPDLRCFALTLHFYSPKAYDYVRQTFKLALPHPDVLRAWYSNVNAEPGFTEESFKTLEFKVAEALEEGKEIVCALIMDEMGIKKGCQRGRDGKVRGHCRYWCWCRRWG